MTWTKTGDEFADECWTLSDAAYRLHLRVLLEQAAPGTDVEWAAEALMALISASFVLHLDRRGFDRDRLVTGWCRTVDALARR